MLVKSSQIGQQRLTFQLTVSKTKNAFVGGSVSGLIIRKQMGTPSLTQAKWGRVATEGWGCLNSHCFLGARGSVKFNIITSKLCPDSPLTILLSKASLPSAHRSRYYGTGFEKKNNKTHKTLYCKAGQARRQEA